MVEQKDIEEFGDYLDTLGIESPTVDMLPDYTIRLKSSAPDEPRQALHTLPELHFDDENFQGPPDLSVLGTLGQGGMGVVHLANQVSLDREVAVKTTRSGTSEAAAQSLLKEAYVTGYVEHPNIIPIYLIGRTRGGAPIIVMKRVEGNSWGEQLDADAKAGRRPDLGAQVEILIQVANALRLAHSRGIIHRDIKPDNVMIGEYGEVYLLDWGIAVSLDDDRPLLPHRSQAQPIAGTPCYMAPEMTQKVVEDLDERTDVYLLGATLHHVLTGEPRHRGATLKDVMYAAFQSQPYDYDESVPAELAAIATRACQRDRDERFESAEAFRDALQGYLQHRESIALSTSAEQKRVELDRLLSQTEIDALIVHDTYGECRFGFHQALRTWPENEQATRGLQACLEAMAGYHLRQGSLDAARVCIADLPEPRPELVTRAEELARQLDLEEVDLKRLKKLERNLDLRTATTSRSLLTLGLGIFWTLTSFWATVRLASGEISLDQDLHNHMVAGFRNVGIAVIGVFAFRRRVFANAANRRVVYLLMTMLLCVAVLRWGGWYLGEELVMARTADSMVYAISIIALGLMSDLRICLLSTTYIVGAIVGVIWPEFQLHVNTAATALTFGGLAWIWSPSQMKKRVAL